MTTHHSKRTVPGSPITKANPVRFSARTPGRSESRTHFNERSRRFNSEDDNSNDVDKVEEALRGIAPIVACKIFSFTHFFHYIFRIS